MDRTAIELRKAFGAVVWILAAVRYAALKALPSVQTATSIFWRLSLAYLPYPRQGDITRTISTTQIQHQRQHHCHIDPGFKEDVGYVWPA